MLHAAVLAALIAVSGSLSSGDKALLSRLHLAVGQLSDKRVAMRRFEQRAPRADIPHFRRLQLHVRPNSAAYAETSFVLAYHGVEYEANIRRLLRPYRLWRSSPGRWAREYTSEKEEQGEGYLDQLTSLEGIPFALNLLYLKHHDLTSLGTWLDLRLDGAYAEGSHQELGELWKRHRVDMLKAAARSRARQGNLAAALSHTYCNTGAAAQDRLLKKKLLASVKPLTRAADPVVREAASGVYELVRREPVVPD